MFNLQYQICVQLILKYLQIQFQKILVIEKLMFFMYCMLKQVKLQKKMIRNDRFAPYKLIIVDNLFELQKKCIENDVNLMNYNTIPTNDIFNQPEFQFRQNEELKFLQLEDIFYFQNYSPHMDNPFFEQSQPHFMSPFQQAHNNRQIQHAEPQTETPLESNRPLFKSSYTKNACFNMCQKTIKVIKKGNFNQKLEELCQNNNIEVEQFKKQIVKRRKDFTGPKALSSYLQANTSQTIVFAQFMKWFLAQKYLRMAINEGQMKNLKVYIQYKNLFIMPLLQ